MNITKEQLELAKSGQPVELAENGEEFVLISKDVYDRVKMALYDDWTEEEMSRLAAQTFEDADNAEAIQ